MIRVCFFGAWDPGYPRNRILREGLRRAGHDVIEARVPETRAFRRWPALALAWSRVARDSDVVLVPEFRHKDVPLARALCGRRALVFDPLVSRWDTLVGDWAIHREGSAQARWNRAIDRWALRAADLVLCDTWAHGELFGALGARPGALRRVFVGAEDAFFSVGEPPQETPLRLLYLGGFLPLHGTGTLLAAAARLERRALPGWELQLVGTGIEYDEARASAQRLALSHVTFIGRLPYSEAARVVSEAHVVLGAFGTSAKAGRVIPHKVWQGLAAGRAVVTGDGPGPREALVDGEHALLVPRGDDAALADALASLIEDRARRLRIAACGRALARSIATPDAVGLTLAAALEGLRS